VLSARHIVKGVGKLTGKLLRLGEREEKSLSPLGIAIIGALVEIN
jgi:hypothetical protein